jgi:hypothetical protein
MQPVGCDPILAFLIEIVLCRSAPQVPLLRTALSAAPISTRTQSTGNAIMLAIIDA